MHQALLKMQQVHGLYSRWATGTHPSDPKTHALSSTWCCHPSPDAAFPQKEASKPSTPVTHHNAPSSPGPQTGVFGIHHLASDLVLKSSTSIYLPKRLTLHLQAKPRVYHYIWKQIEALQWFLFAFNNSPNLSCVHLIICRWGGNHTYAYRWGIPHGRRHCCHGM